jgi:uncharacterized protein
MIDFKNKHFIGSENRKSLFDCKIPVGAKAVIIFVHGYKGFKDWGAWNLMQDAFVNDGFGFVKFNMSHNGGTIDEAVDFPDLEAFGNNRYTFEVNDLRVIVDEVHRMIVHELALNIPIHLLGHSRGGGIAILGASHDKRISKLISLAGISNIESRFPEDELDDWRREGVKYVLNGRTHQQMPHFYSFYENFSENRAVLSIEKAAKKLEIPFLQIHGDMDQSVSISEGLNLSAWTDTQVGIIKGAEHTFGASHPWESKELPADLMRVVKMAIDFFNK